MFDFSEGKKPFRNCAMNCRFAWSGGRGSNPRRPAWEAGILPLNYPRSSPDLSNYNVREDLQNAYNIRTTNKALFRIPASNGFERHGNDLSRPLNMGKTTPKGIETEIRPITTHNLTLFAGPCNQNDSMAGECTDATLSSAIDPVNAEDLRAGVLESFDSKPSFCCWDATDNTARVDGARYRTVT